MTTAARRDYYAVLGVPRGADEKEVRSAYRRLARRYHPDVNPGDPAAEQRFKEISEAYEVLSDPKKRGLYDRYGHNWRQAQRMGERGVPFGFAQDRPFGRAHGEGGDVPFDQFGAGDLGDLFGDLFGRGFGRVRTAASTTVEVQLTLEEAYQGAKRVLQLPMGEPCRQCQGTGRAGGRGCPVCRGSGSITDRRRVEATIPPGVDTGSQVPVGLTGRQVLLQVTVVPDSRFRREGADLHAQATIPLYAALLGGEAKVLTLKGQVSLTIPPETQNGQVFRLTGQGMPHLGNPARKGDLYVTVQVALPARLTAREKELLTQLRVLRPS